MSLLLSLSLSLNLLLLIVLMRGRVGRSGDRFGDAKTPAASIDVRESRQLRAEAVAAERERIYRDLHDDLGAKLLQLIYAAPTAEVADQARAFFRDLCTPAELQAMSDRWAVVELLQRGLPYREIQRLTGVSVTTVGRVARYLNDGNGGYAIAAGRLRDSREG